MAADLTARHPVNRAPHLGVVEHIALHAASPGRHLVAVEAADRTAAAAEAVVAVADRAAVVAEAAVAVVHAVADTQVARTRKTLPREATPFRPVDSAQFE